MRKILSLIVAVMMTATMLVISASAESIIFGGEYCDISVDVKKADSSAVIKDGIISENEYERANISVSLEDSMLGLGFSTSEVYINAEEMLKTVEYYFSWDEVHGFNFAVKFKPTTILQEFEQPEKQFLDAEGIEINGVDDFLNQTGIHVSVGENLRLYDKLRESFEGGFIYRWAVAKRTTDGKYISSYYTKGGLLANTPVPGEDYIIEYTDDGYVICEYSIDFAEINPNANAGSELYISIGVTGGTSTPDTLHSSSYSVNLGEYTYYMLRGKDSQNGRFILMEEQIPNNAVATETTTDDATTDDATTAGVTTAGVTTAVTTEAPTQPATSTVVTEAVKVTDTDGNVATDANGDEITTIITSIVTDAPTQSAGTDDDKAPATGDPMIIVAVVAAISACGAVVAKKRK